MAFLWAPVLFLPRLIYFQVIKTNLLLRIMWIRTVTIVSTIHKAEVFFVTGRNGLSRPFPNPWLMVVFPFTGIVPIESYEKTLPLALWTTLKDLVLGHRMWGVAYTQEKTKTKVSLLINNLLHWHWLSATKCITISKLITARSITFLKV